LFTKLQVLILSKHFRILRKGSIEAADFVFGYLSG